MVPVKKKHTYIPYMSISMYANIGLAYAACSIYTLEIIKQIINYNLPPYQFLLVWLIIRRAYLNLLHLYNFPQDFFALCEENMYRFQK
jgi:hypothetical protein